MSSLFKTSHMDCQVSTPVNPDMFHDENVIFNLESLIGSILAGEDPTSEETTDQWRARIEGYAMALDKNIRIAPVKKEKIVGKTVYIDTFEDGSKVATIVWDGKSDYSVNWWGSDEMFTLTPEEDAARTALIPIFQECADQANPRPILAKEHSSKSVTENPKKRSMISRLFSN